MKVVDAEDKPLGRQTNLHNCPSNLNNKYFEMSVNDMFVEYFKVLNYVK